MTGSDDRILEFLADSGAAHNLRGMEINFADRGEPISYSTLKRRLPILDDHGLVRELECQGSYYAISEKGREYLAGELDAADLESEA